MAELTTIARPYAEATFRRALETDQLAQWGVKLALLANLAAEPRVAQAISNPRLTRSQRVQIMVDLCGDQLDQEGRQLLDVLADHHRLSIMGSIAEQYEALRHAREGVLDALVVSAFPMDEHQLQEVIQPLVRRFGKQVRAQVAVDPALLGGVSITIGDVVIDASVRARLEQMSFALKH